MHRILFTIEVIGLVTQGVIAADGAAAGLKLVGHSTGMAAVSRVMRLNDHTVLADSGAVYHVTDPEAPQWVADSDFTAVALKLVGTTGYLAAGRNGLIILDVKNPAQLVRLGGYRSGGDARRVEILGTFAYVSAVDGGLRVINVADPTRTDQVAQYPSSLAETLVANDLVMRDKLAFFAAGPDTLEVLRVTSPTGIFRAGGLRTGLNTLWLDWLGDRLLLAGETGGLLISDVSDPAKPTLVGQYAPPADATDIWRGMAIVQDLCYVAAGSDGILIVDCSAPARPKLVGAYKPLEPVVGVTALAGRIIASHGSAGFSVLEPTVNAPLPPHIVSEPQSITVALGGTVRLEVEVEPATGVSYQWYFGATPIAEATGSALVFDAVTRDREGDYSVAVSNDGGVAHSATARLTVVLPPEILQQPGSLTALEGETVTLGVSAINGPLEYQWYKDGAAIPAGLGSTLTIGPLTSALTGDYAVRIRNLAGSVTSGVATVTMRRALVLRPLGRWPATPDGEFLGQVRVAGKIAYVAQGSAGLQVLDLTDPANPRRLGGYLDSGYNSRFQIVGNRLYLADGNIGGLAVLDIANPSQPVRLGKIQTGSSVNDVCVVENLAYLAAGVKGLAIVDIGQPAAMRIVGGTTESYNAVGIDVSNHWAFVADSTGGLLILDVTDPTQPVPIAQYGKPVFGEYSITDVQVVGNLAYVPRTYDGFSVVDVSDPAHPEGIGHVAGYSRNVRVIGDYAYVGRLDEGFRVLDISAPRHPLIVAQRDTPGEVADLDVAGDLLLVADGKNGLLIYQSTLSGETPPQFLTVERVADSTTLRLRFPSESRAVLQRSTELLTWIPFQTNQPTAGAVEFSIEPSVGPAAAYFRVRP